MSLKKIAREHLYIKPMGYAKAKEIVAGMKIANNAHADARTRAIKLIVAYGINPMKAQQIVGIKPQTALYPRIRNLCEKLVGVESDFKPSPVMTEKQFEFYCDVINEAVDGVIKGFTMSDNNRYAAMVHLVYGEDDINTIKSLFDVDADTFFSLCQLLVEQKQKGL